MSRRERCGIGRCARPAPYLLRHLSFWSPVTRDPRSGPLEPSHCRSLPPLSRPPNLEPRYSCTLLRTFSTCKPIPANACGAGNRSLESRTPGTITCDGPTRRSWCLSAASACHRHQSRCRNHARPPPLALRFLCRSRSATGESHSSVTGILRFDREVRSNIFLSNCSF